MAEDIKKYKKVGEINNEQNKPDTSDLFRVPWSISDNAFSWLEITRRCDLNCSYCYQTSDPSSDKTISQIENKIHWRYLLFSFCKT